MQGVIGADCFQYNRLDNVWVYLQTMQIERSYAAADIVEVINKERNKDLETLLFALITYINSTSLSLRGGGVFCLN